MLELRHAVSKCCASTSSNASLHSVLRMNLMSPEREPALVMVHPLERGLVLEIASYIGSVRCGKDKDAGTVEYCGFSVSPQ